MTDDENSILIIQDPKLYQLVFRDLVPLEARVLSHVNSAKLMCHGTMMQPSSVSSNPPAAAALPSNELFEQNRSDDVSFSYFLSELKCKTISTMTNFRRITRDEEVKVIYSSPCTCQGKETV